MTACGLGVQSSDSNFEFILILSCEPYYTRCLTSTQLLFPPISRYFWAIGYRRAGDSLSLYSREKRAWVENSSPLYHRDVLKVPENYLWWFSGTFQGPLIASGVEGGGASGRTAFGGF